MRCRHQDGIRNLGGEGGECGGGGGRRPGLGGRTWGEEAGREDPQTAAQFREDSSKPTGKSWSQQSPLENRGAGRGLPGVPPGPVRV